MHSLNRVVCAFALEWVFAIRKRPGKDLPTRKELTVLNWSLAFDLKDGTNIQQLVGLEGPANVFDLSLTASNLGWALSIELAVLLEIDNE